MSSLRAHSAWPVGPPCGRSLFSQGPLPRRAARLGALGSQGLPGSLTFSLSTLKFARSFRVARKEIKYFVNSLPDVSSLSTSFRYTARSVRANRKTCRPVNARFCLQCNALVRAVMEDLLHPIERNVHSYLSSSVAKDLVEALAKLSLVRPADPYLWLAEEFLRKSPRAAELRITLVASGAAATEEGGPSSRSSSRGESARRRSHSRGRSRERSASSKGGDGSAPEARRSGSASGRRSTGSFAAAALGGAGFSGAERPGSGGAFTDITSRPSTTASRF